jgi:metabolite-proton symporter
MNQPAKAPMGRIVTTALAGASIEWYDFFIYGTAAALVFPALFFPGSDPMAATLLSFGTFAVGFVARPVGGVIFGHYGDKVGRKRSLVAALLLMGLTTTSIGLMPTYATIGVWAPVLLVVLRFAQGIAIGGQWGGAVLLLTESAPPERRGFYGSFAQLGVPMGVLLANLVFLLVTHAFGDEALQEWAWRLPFLFSVVLIGIGAYVNLRLEETPAFAQAQKQSPPARGSPILRALREHPRIILLAAGAFVAVNSIFYIFITYIVAYGTKTLGLPKTTVLGAVMISAVVQSPMLVIAADISDRVGRHRVFLWGAGLLGLWSLVFFPLVDTGSFLGIVVALTIGQAFLSLMYGPQAALFGELFPVEIRYSGASLGYQIGAIFGGAFAPLIAAFLLAATGNSMAIGVYMSLMCAVSFISILLLRGARIHD